MIKKKKSLPQAIRYTVLLNDLSVSYCTVLCVKVSWPRSTEVISYLPDNVYTEVHRTYKALLADISNTFFSLLKSIGQGRPTRKAFCCTCIYGICTSCSRDHCLLPNYNVHWNETVMYTYNLYNTRRG